MADLGTGIMGGVSLIGGLMGKSSAEKAADMQMQASQQAIAEQRRQYEQSRQDTAPWREAGQNALGRLQALMGLQGGQGNLLQPFTGDSVASEPGYQFGLDEGMKALNNQAAARGMYGSGAAMKGLTRYAQDYAGSKFNEAFNRDQATKAQQYNMLAGVSGSGQTAANQVASMGMQNAGMVGNYLTQGANAAAAGRVGGTNALLGGIDDVASYYRLQSLLKGP